MKKTFIKYLAPELYCAGVAIEEGYAISSPDYTTDADPFGSADGTDDF